MDWVYYLLGVVTAIVLIVIRNACGDRVAYGCNNCDKIFGSFDKYNKHRTMCK